MLNERRKNYYICSNITTLLNNLFHTILLKSAICTIIFVITFGKTISYIHIVF